jgi:mRNA interferase MazF
MTFPRRGEIYLVAFDPTVGHEIQKTRPAVVIQNDVSNQYSPITIVAAISSQFRDPPHPREVPIPTVGKRA